MLKGVDISAYQSSIPAGDFAILKATEGVSFNDGRFKGWWDTLHKEKKLRGAYHFARPDNNGAVAEADHFLKIVKAAGLQPGDLLVLDHETRGSSAAHDAQWAADWCAHVKAKTGIVPVVYTFLSFGWEGRCHGLGGYPLWIADPSSPAGKPRVPAPWSHWYFHQYSENGGIDHDMFNGDKTTWAKLAEVWGKGSIPPPKPTPPPAPTHPVIKEGASGAAVTEAQKDLNRHGAKLTVDGKFGPKTTSATKAFQTHNHLVSDGVIGGKTWALLVK